MSTLLGRFGPFSMTQLMEDLAVYLRPVRFPTDVRDREIETFFATNVRRTEGDQQRSLPPSISVEDKSVDILSPMSKSHSMMSAMEIHEAFGHPGRELSKVQGIPYPEHCSLCEMGNRVKAPTTRGVIPRSTAFGDTIHVDFKISSTPSSDKITVLCGAVDDATNYGWVLPMEFRSEVLQSMREVRVDIRRLGGELKHVHTDNDSVITSRAFKSFDVTFPLSPTSS